MNYCPRPRLVKAFHYLGDFEKLKGFMGDAPEHRLSQIYPLGSRVLTPKLWDDRCGDRFVHIGCWVVKDPLIGVRVLPSDEFCQTYMEMPEG